jgi:hypothetical protein
MEVGSLGEEESSRSRVEDPCNAVDGRYVIDALLFIGLVGLD